MSDNGFDLEKLTTEFIDSFEVGNFEKMQDLMSKEVKSYITNAKSEVNLLEGRDAFIQNIVALDITNVKPIVRICQMTRINQNQVMVMIEVKAKRKGKSLHNFAAYLIYFKDGLISEIRMVEALPAYSDEFWKS